MTVTGSGLVFASVVSGAFLGALLTAMINIWLARRTRHGEERDRVRTAFAGAFAAYAAYKEVPYAIRRRADAPAEERVRLSEILRGIQADVAYHLAWTAAESEPVGHAYTNLINAARAIAGTAMHGAWLTPAPQTDSAMNIPASTIDLTELAPYETAYIAAARAHLKRLAPWWAR
jgi:DNA-binding FadR family transcriptional regulator